MEWILLLLWLLFMSVFGVSSETGTPPMHEGTARIDTVIESVDVLILESYPAQLQLHITGYQPDGCDYLVQVEQTITGDTINVHIYREMPSAIMCTANIIPYDATIAIDGGFTSGMYTINVNGFTTQVDFGSARPTPTPFGVPSAANLTVETVNAAAQSGAPSVVIVHITGYYDDACDFPVMASQTRDGDSFNISLSREIPPNVRCAAGPTAFSLDVALNDSLMEGTYAVDVNGVVATFSIP